MTCENEQASGTREGVGGGVVMGMTSLTCLPWHIHTRKEDRI